jgi:hypothetical protein
MDLQHFYETRFQVIDDFLTLLYLKNYTNSKEIQLISIGIEHNNSAYLRTHFIKQVYIRLKNGTIKKYEIGPYKCVKYNDYSLNTNLIYALKQVCYEISTSSWCVFIEEKYINELYIFVKEFAFTKIFYCFLKKNILLTLIYAS